MKEREGIAITALVERKGAAFSCLDHFTDSTRQETESFGGEGSSNWRKSSVG
jgi:hypothetical protein